MMEAFLVAAAAAVVALVVTVARLVHAEKVANRKQNAWAAAYFANRDANYQKREAALDQLLTKR